MKNSNRQLSRSPESQPRDPIWIKVDGIVPAKKNRRVIFKGKSFPNEEYRKWERKVKTEVRSLLHDPTCDPTPFGRERPCTATIVIAFADRRRRDVDNMVSSWLDALQASGILEDDRWTVVGAPKVVIKADGTPWSGCLLEDGNRDVERTLDDLKSLTGKE